MRTIRVSVAVMAHRRRERFVPELLTALDPGGRHGVQVVWDQRNDRWDTGRRAMAAYDPAASHHLVVQDDAIVCRDLIPGVVRALQLCPAADGTPTPLCLYAGRVRPFRDAVQHLVDTAGPGTAWLTMSQLHWGVGVVMPTGLIDQLLTWGDGRPDIANYDKRISRWLQHQGLTVWYPWPSLVEHRHQGSPSLVPGRGSAGRRAHAFLGVDKSAVDDWNPAGTVVSIPSLNRPGTRVAGRVAATPIRSGPSYGRRQPRAGQTPRRL